MTRRYPYPDIEDQLTQLLAQGMKDREAVASMRKGLGMEDPTQVKRNPQLRQGQWLRLLGFDMDDVGRHMTQFRRVGWHYENDELKDLLP